LENFFNELYREVESPHYRFDIDALEMKVDLLNREIQEVKGHSGPSNSQKNAHGNHHH
jgi:hypothetical protein